MFCSPNSPESSVITGRFDNNIILGEEDMILVKCIRFLSVFGYICLSACALAGQQSSPESNADGLSRPDVHIFIKTKYTETFGSDASISQTEIPNARIKLNGSLSQDAGYGIQIDTVRDDVLLDAWVMHRIFSCVSVKAGQFKTPYGTDNLVSSPKMAFVSRSLIKKHAAPPCRDCGLVTACRFHRLELLGGIMNGSGVNAADINNGKSVACRSVLHILTCLDVAGNYYNGRTVTAGGDTETFYDFDMHGSRGRWEYAIEYSHRDCNSDPGYAAYAYVAYDILAGLQRLETVTPAFRMETCDPGNDEFQRYTIGLTMHFTRKNTNRLMINYEWYSGEDVDVDDSLICEFLVYY